MTALITATFLILTASALAALNSTRTPHDATRLELQPSTTRIAEQQTAVWNCQAQLGHARTPVSVEPWKLPRSAAYRQWVLTLWQQRRKACIAELHLVAQVNRNLYRLAVCETGGINGGLPLWTHHNSTYSGALGFAHSTWAQFKPDGYPAHAAQATPGQQLAVGRILVETFGGYSSWPACHRRLGLPG